MKNIAIIASIVILGISCNPEKFESINAGILGLSGFDPARLEVDSSLLNDPKFKRYLYTDGDASFTLQMDCGSTEVGYEPRPKLLVSPLDLSAKNYDYIVSTRTIDADEETVLPKSAAEKADEGFRYKLSPEQILGKLVTVRAEKKSDKLQKFEFSTYVPEKIKMLNPANLTHEAPYFSINQNVGYTLKWNPDKHSKVVRIKMEHNEMLLSESVERKYFMIYARDKGEYFVKPEQLALFSKGLVTFTITRGEVDAFTIKGLYSHVDLFTCQSMSISANLE